MIESPKAAGYRMPAEYEPHHGTLMVWPTRPGSWPFDGQGPSARSSKPLLKASRSISWWMKHTVRRPNPCWVMVLPTWTSPPTMRGLGIQVRRFWSMKMAELCLSIGPLTLGAEAMMVFIRTMRQMIRWLVDLVRPSVCQSMMPIPLSWKEEPSIATVKEPSW